MSVPVFHRSALGSTAVGFRYSEKNMEGRSLLAAGCCTFPIRLSLFEEDGVRFISYSLDDTQTIEGKSWYHPLSCTPLTDRAESMPSMMFSPEQLDHGTEIQLISVFIISLVYLL